MTIVPSSHDFDGHLERPPASLAAAERIWWLEQTMRLAAAARPLVPGGTGILRSVHLREGVLDGVEPEPPSASGDGPVDFELRLAIDDRSLFVSWAQRGADRTEVAAAESSFMSAEARMVEFDLGDTPTWRPLVGRFVVMRYLAPERDRVEIAGDVGEPAVVLFTDDGDTLYVARRGQPDASTR